MSTFLAPVLVGVMPFPLLSGLLLGLKLWHTGFVSSALFSGQEVGSQWSLRSLPN